MIRFEHLTPEVIVSVVDKFLIELETRLQEKEVHLQVDDDVRNWFAKRGYDKDMGARPMTRLIQDELKKPLADEILFGKLVGGGRVVLTVKDDKIAIGIEEMATHA